MLVAMMTWHLFPATSTETLTSRTSSEIMRQKYNKRKKKGNHNFISEFSKASK
jgi:hypothetical protein